MRKACILSLVAVGLAVAGGRYANVALCAEAPTVEMPADGVDAARGDEWTYLTQDTLTGESLSEQEVVVVDRQGNEIDVRLRITDPRTGAVRVGAATFDSFWRRLPDDSDSGQGTQDNWGIKPGLRVGDDWNYDFERPLAGGPIKMRWIGHGEALGIESVDLPNGMTVKAMKIEFFERPSVARYRFEMHVVEWFAPEINRYVRREFESRLSGKVVESTSEVLLDYIRRR